MNTSSGPTGTQVLSDERLGTDDIILWQEHKLPRTQCQAYAHKLAQGKRLFHFEPAIRTDKGGLSSGVAIGTRAYIGHSPPATLGTSTIVPGRVLARHIHGLLPGGILCISVYFHLARGSQGAIQHTRCLQRLGAFLARFNRPFVVGGDWNCEPADIEATGTPARLQATIVHTSGPTCDTKTGSGLTSRCLDFFLLSDVLVPLIRRLEALDLHMPSHKAIRLTLANYATIPLIRVPRCPRPLPASRPQGPNPRFEEWSAMSPLLDPTQHESIMAIARGNRTAAQEFLTSAINGVA